MFRGLVELLQRIHINGLDVTIIGKSAVGERIFMNSKASHAFAQHTSEVQRKTSADLKPSSIYSFTNHAFLKFLSSHAQKVSSSFHERKNNAAFIDRDNYLLLNLLSAV